jgi:hypothetical protein
MVCKKEFEITTYRNHDYEGPEEWRWWGKRGEGGG